MTKSDKKVTKKVRQNSSAKVSNKSFTWSPDSLELSLLISVFSQYSTVHVLLVHVRLYLMTPLLWEMDVVGHATLDLPGDLLGFAELVFAHLRGRRGG